MSSLKGKTYEEIMGKEKAEKLKKQKSEFMKGKLKSFETRQKISKKQKERFKDGKNLIGVCNIDNKGTNYSKIYSPWNKGLTKETDERVRKQGEKIKTTENDIKWKETKGKEKNKKLKESLKNINRIPWNKGLTKTTSSKLDKIGTKISKSLKERWKKLSEKEKNKIITHLRKVQEKQGKGRYTNTKPEREFKQFLKSLNLNFEQNRAIIDIKHKYNADFYLNNYNLIIEIDGEYWHNFPFGREIDIQRTLELQEAGYYIMRIWDTVVDVVISQPEVFLEYLENISFKENKN